MHPLCVCLLCERGQGHTQAAAPSARLAGEVTVLYSPSAQEKAAHYHAHNRDEIQFRAWCSLCVRARAADEPQVDTEPADKEEGACQECGHRMARAVLQDCGRCEAQALCPLCVLGHNCKGPEKDPGTQGRTAQGG